MKLKSILALLVIGITSLGLVGCGSSNGTSNTEFVATDNDAAQSNLGNLVFNFVTPQSAFTVDANTNTLQFDFFDAAAVSPVLTTTRAFAASVTISNVPTSVRTVRITGFDANLIPLFTISQAIDVVGGNTVTIDGISNAVAVTLSSLRLAPGDLTQLNADPPVSVTSLDVPVGGTGQVFLIGDYSNGSQVLLGDQATYQLDTGGDAFASVSTLGTVTGLAAGNTTFIATFGGQTLSIPLTVAEPGAQNFDSIANVNATLTASTTQPLQLGTTATRTISGVPVTFGLANGDPRLTYSSSGADFTVTATGVVTPATGTIAGTTGTITTTYTNPNSSVLTVDVTVTAQ